MEKNKVLKQVEFMLKALFDFIIVSIASSAETISFSTQAKIKETYVELLRVCQNASNTLITILPPPIEEERIPFSLSFNVDISDPEFCKKWEIVISNDYTAFIVYEVLRSGTRKSIYSFKSK